MRANTVVRGGVRLPCSSPRTCRDKFAKLLSHVDPEAEHGFGFEGHFHRPGAVLTDAELRPGLNFPATPILLEYMRGASHGIPGRLRAEQVYILWRYEPHENAWRELGRAVSFAWEWAAELRPLAVRALREARGGQLVVITDLPAIAQRIGIYLNTELNRLDGPERNQVLAILHDQLAARLCA